MFLKINSISYLFFFSTFSSTLNFRTPQEVEREDIRKAIGYFLFFFFGFQINRICQKNLSGVFFFFFFFFLKKKKKSQKFHSYNQIGSTNLLNFFLRNSIATFNTQKKIYNFENAFVAIKSRPSKVHMMAQPCSMIM